MTTQCRLVEQPHAIGEFCWVRSGDGQVTGIDIILPGGSRGFGRRVIHMVTRTKPSQHPFWYWDGNEEKPTLEPSLDWAGPGPWHGSLINGALVQA